MFRSNKKLNRINISMTSLSKISYYGNLEDKHIALTSPEFWQLKSHYFRDPLINAVSLLTFHGNLHYSTVFSRLCDLHYQSILVRTIFIQIHDQSDSKVAPYDLEKLFHCKRAIANKMFECVWPFCEVGT